MSVEQVNATNNQSALKVELTSIFLFGNQYDKRTLSNTTAGAQITAKAGNLLFKNAAATVDVLSVAANISSIVGILAIENDTDVANAGTLSVNMAVSGTIAEEKIILPGGITCDTVIPTTLITLRDHLNSLGFHLETSVDNTKFDNL